MCNPRASLPSLVLFDIGGVVVPSPLLAINRYEIDHNLPPDYLNVSIRFRGETGAFQRFERGEIDLWDFYRDFGDELSQVKEGNEWYSAWCRETGRVIPKEEELPVAEGPRALKVDGRELFGLMMRHSTTPNELVVGAIERLRASGKFRICALTNNFAPPTSMPSSSSSSSSASSSSRPPTLDEELSHLGLSSATSTLKSLFDVYYESSLLGSRKPELTIYKHVLSAEGLESTPDKVVFLDDIGPNLKAARSLGIRTIRVGLESPLQALEDLERHTRMELIDSEARKREKARMRDVLERKAKEEGERKKRKEEREKSSRKGKL